MAMTTQETSPMTLAHFRIASLPSTAYYIPNFLTTSEHDHLLSSVLSQPKTKWTYLTHRRLQTHPSALTPSGHLLATVTALPKWLRHPVVERMQELGIWINSPHGAPNHVLVNEYEPCQGIRWHEDGAAYWPCVATISLGASIVLEVVEKGDGRQLQTYRILQEPGSLLVTTDEIYTHHLHGIAEIDVDEGLTSNSVANWNLLGAADVFKDGRNVRQTRVSLTYRDVLKVSKAGGLLFGRLKR